MDDDPLPELVGPINAALERACAPAEGCPPVLADAMRYSLLAPGKRLRPALVLLAAQSCGGAAEAAMPAAVAVEMIHAYSLIHDDLPSMDDDDLRRGRPTCHIKFGQGIAILAGDALQARAFELTASLQPAAAAQQACAILAAAAGRSALVGGQADDLRAEQHEVPHTSELLDSIHRRKTGALLAAAAQLGGVSAGASETQLSALSQYGHALGLAFQITDDLLDVEGRGEAIGKETGKDSARGKLTYPGLVGVEPSRQRARDLVQRAQQSLREMPGPLSAPAVRRLNWIANFVVERNR